MYGNPNYIIHRDLWSSLRAISNSINGRPWLAVVDFNSVLRQENKCGGRSILRLASQEFSTCLQDCGLLELEFKGPSFTWESRGIAERLDWGFCNDKWKLCFPFSFVDHLVKQKSDHCPILI